MKKSKLLMLSTIAAFTSVAPIMTITSCGNTPKGKSEFVCDETTQETEIGNSACWYIFNLTGTRTIPKKDLKIEFAETIPEKLVTQPLWHIVEGSGDKKLKVGIDGKSKLLDENESVDFKLRFTSDTLQLDQTFDCTYKFHKSKVTSTSPRVVDKDPSTLVENDYYFSLDDTSISIDDLYVSIDVVDKSPTITTDFVEDAAKPQKSGEKVWVKTKLAETGKVIGQAGDYIKFNLIFHDLEWTWSQTITNFGFEFKEVEYNHYNLDKETQVVIDYKGNKQEALKAMNGEHGVLTTDTKVGTPFAVTFDLSNWKKEWTTGSQWKFGSYVHPTQSHVPYYHYSNISIYATINGESKPIEQTEPGDYDGEHGQWWVSDGGPITVLFDKITEEYGENPTQLIFRLRIADKITNESSFYITYA